MGASVGIARSPLIHGGDLARTDDFTWSLLTNDEVLAVNQRSSGNRQLFRSDDGLVAWVATAEDGATCLAVFDVRDARPVPVDLAALGFEGEVAVRDLWQRADLPTVQGRFSPDVAPHGARLFRLAARHPAIRAGAAVFCPATARPGRQAPRNPPVRHPSCRSAQGTSEQLPSSPRRRE